MAFPYNQLQIYTQICVICTQRPILFFNYLLILVINPEQI
jgi:hypothetical protein